MLRLAESETANVTAEVIVDGTAAALYNDDDCIEKAIGDAGASTDWAHVAHFSPLHTQVVSKYIEIAAGAKFSIRLFPSPSAYHGCDALKVVVWIDGVKAVEEIGTGRPSQIIIWSKCSFAADGSYTYQELQFADLLTDEEPPPKGIDGVKAAATASRLGTIDVALHRVWVISQNENPVPAKEDEFAAPTRPVSEKLLKGKCVSQRVSLGPPMAGRGKMRFLTTRLADGHALAAFRFKYRSKDDLKKLYIIPRTPEPDLENDYVSIVNGPTGVTGGASTTKVKQETVSKGTKRSRTHGNAPNDEDLGTKRTKTHSTDNYDVHDDIIEINTVTVAEREVIDLTEDSDH